MDRLLDACEPQLLQVAPEQLLMRRPLLLMLDALDDTDTHVLMEARSWANGSIKSLSRVLDPVSAIVLCVQYCCMVLCA